MHGIIFSVLDRVFSTASETAHGRATLLCRTDFLNVVGAEHSIAYYCNSNKLNRKSRFSYNQRLA
jgi:hypothetical protein